MSLRRPRAGELLAAAGAALVIVSLLEPWYEGPAGKLDAWDTFGPAMLLLLAATAAAIALTLSTVTEHSVALPVAIGVWSVLLGLLAVIAAAVRLLERRRVACAGRGGGDSRRRLARAARRTAIAVPAGCPGSTSATVGVEAACAR